ncbi:hypothetical protein [Saccharicrinis sp. GN24d3]|uniref:hypothetical protein n=1 Tax=Saccharicrinis sp. GN24d3 TaxID=3458416 RepID=UPI004036727A
MNIKTLIKYSVSPRLSPSRIRAMFIYGIILILIGLFGWYKSGFKLNPFWYILAIGGVLHIIQSLFGKELTKERIFISFGNDVIEYSKYV